MKAFTRKGRGLVIKTIRELAHEEFLAVIHVGSKASKAFKGVLFVFFLSQRSLFYQGTIGGVGLAATEDVYRAIDHHFGTW